jgi:hypothetical protein
LNNQTAHHGRRAGRRRAIAALASIVLGWAASSAPAKPAADDAAAKAVIFVSDTQGPIFWETLLLPRQGNEEARAAIFERILAEPSLAAFFHLGDIVARGSSEEDWKPIDEVLGRLTKLGVPVYAGLGNHELLSTAAQGRANFRRRFPQFARSWFSVRIPPLAVIVLDSNLGALSAAERAAQAEFYRRELAALDAVPAVRGIVVCTHHPPFTNSTIVRPSAGVKAEFVPSFLSAPKALLFLSGHSHAAEHFIWEGKHFLVLGGGGGLLHPLLLSINQRTEDHFPIAFERRWFHYVRLEINADGVTVTFRMLRQDLQSLVDIYEIRIPFKGGSEKAPH